MTDAVTRAARFLYAMGHQEDAVTVRAHSAPRVQGRVGRQFLNALKLGLPFVTMVASVHAQAPTTPTIAWSVDNAPVIELNAVDQVNEVRRHFVEAELKQSKDQAAIETVVNCFKNTIVNTDLSQTEKMFAAVAIHVQVPTLVHEIQEWAKTHNMPTEVGIAAYCENPFDWKGQVQNWASAAKKVEQALSHNAPSDGQATDAQAVSTLMNVYSSNALERHAIQRASQHQAIEEAARYQFALHKQGVAHAQKVSGFDWIAASVEVARGAASLVGGREAEREAARAGIVVRRGAGVAQRVDRSSDRKGAAQWREIGRAAQEAGRILHDIDIPSRTPRMRY